MQKKQFCKILNLIWDDGIDVTLNKVILRKKCYSSFIVKRPRNLVEIFKRALPVRN